MRMRFSPPTSVTNDAPAESILRPVGIRTKQVPLTVVGQVPAETSLELAEVPPELAVMSMQQEWIRYEHWREPLLLSPTMPSSAQAQRAQTRGR